MAYSRWTNSVWFTFGTLNNGTMHSKKRSDWYFAILCDSLGNNIGGFGYEEIKNDVDKCISAVRKSIDNEKPPVITEKELRELKEYMLEFVYDIEKDCEEP